MIFWQKLPKIVISFILGGQFFFHTNPYFLWPIFSKFLDCCIRFKMFDYAQKYEKGSFFFLLTFCNILPIIVIFFIFGGQFFFTPILTFCDHCYLHFWIVALGLKCLIMLKNMKKARFSYFSWFICQKLPKIVFFSISMVNFISNTFTIYDQLFFQF